MTAAARTDIRERLGATPVINLTGTLTTLGGINARPEAIAAAAEIMACGVDIVELQAAASRLIAAVTGAEAGFVSACSSAGICMATTGMAVTPVPLSKHAEWSRKNLRIILVLPMPVSP